MMLAMRRAVLLCAAAILAWQPAHAGEQPRAEDSKQERSRQKPTISKATTYFTEPLTAAGDVDYAAAINGQLSRGVTPENNANVLFWKAMGPEPVLSLVAPEFFKWLGMAVPAEQGDYFLDLSEYLEQVLGIKSDNPEFRQIDEHQGLAIERPWKSDQYPRIAAWLKANEKPLALVVAGTKRSEYFAPLVNPKDVSTSLVSVSMPGLAKARSFARALTARAMLHVGEGRTREAWQDLQACHRLGRFVGRGATMVEALVSIGIDSTATRADLAILEHTKPDARQIRVYLNDLATLPPLPEMAAKIELGERCIFLDSMQLFANEGADLVAGVLDLDKGIDALLTRLVMRGIDWNTTMRTGNQWYNRMVKTLRDTNRQDREREFDQMDRELKVVGQVPDGLKQSLKLVLATRESRGEALGNILVGLLLPAVRNIKHAEEQAIQKHDNLRIAFALAAYRNQHGAYPKTLDQLAPRFLKQVAADGFSGKPLVYRPNNKGYLLYSVGRNGKDEDGRDQYDDPTGDDIKVRIPLRSKP